MSAENMVTLTIDGQEVTVPAGTLVIRAAEQLGAYVPRFCDHPLLDPLGACRQCLVEIEGQRKPLTACTTTVSEGMVVRTQVTSEIAADAQEGVLELLLINHPLDCPMCDKGGECPLQDQALAYGPGGSRYIDPKRRFAKPIPISPLVKLDRERCVLCARCTRFADQIAGDPFIELFERGALEQVAIFEDEPYESLFSGNVIQICPVGALTSSTFRFRARPFDMSSTSSTCTRCASGCSIEVQDRRGQLVRVLARENHAVNDEWICDKGRFAWAYASDPERVTEPMVRKNGEFVAVSWAEALARVAEGITQARDEGKRIGVLAGEQLADEDSYAVSRFARTVLGTNDVDSRRSGSDEDGAVRRAWLRDGGATMADIDGAAAVIVVGTDLQQESPIVFLRLRKRERRGGLVLHEIGPARTALARSGATWSACAPGGETGVLAGLLGAIDDGAGSALDAVKRRVAAQQADDDAIRDVASRLRRVEGPVVVLAGERLASSPGALTRAWNLAVSLGGRFGLVTRKGGARGAAWAGCAPDALPGGRSVADDAERAEVEAIWGTEIPAAPGRATAEILSGAAGALFLIGSDPVADVDRAVAERAIDDAGFVVAHDLFLTESAKRADVVLPAAAAYERDGSISAWDGTRGEIRAAVAAAGVSGPDHEILARVAQALGVGFPSTIADLRAEMESLAAPGVPAAMLAEPAGEAHRPAGLVLAVTPALVDDGTMMRGADALAQAAAARGEAALSPSDAARLGVATGDGVVVIAGMHRFERTARVTASVCEGVVAMYGRIGAEVRLNGSDAIVERASR